MTEKINILKSVIKHWSERQDIDAVLEHLSDDLVWHFSAATQPPVYGKAGARQFLEGLKKRVTNPRWRIFRYAESDDALFVEDVDEFESPDGTTVTIPYMGVLDFDDGLIVGWRDCFDRGIADYGVAGKEMPGHCADFGDRKALSGIGAPEEVAA